MQGLAERPAGRQTTSSVAVDFMRGIVPRVLTANLVAAAIVYLFLAVASPPESTTDESFAIEVSAFVAYVIIAAVLGLRAGQRTFAPVAGWLDKDREPTPTDVHATLEQPLKQALWVVVAWSIGSVAFALLHALPNNPLHHAPGYGAFIGAVGLLGALAAGMLTYLLVEQDLRPVFARALEAAAPRRPRTLGIKQRVIVSWALGSGVVLVAIALTPAASPRLAVAILFLAPLGLIAGGLMIALAARSVATPIAGMRNALADVESGRFEVRVVVDDASEVGLLQAGFNRMAAGLQERERLRSIFGTYVDPDVAEHILKTGTALTGEEVDVTVMFLDIRDFTGLAERAPAQEVVATLNRLFERVVPIIHDHHGHVDKFVGDGLLAVFGAPRRASEHATLAVRAAVEIEQAVREEFESELHVGIGFNSGQVVAGNVGGGGRLEFSVIGDVVNVAARIETATRETGDTILISETTKALLEGAPFTLEERTGLKLKGKAEPVCLFSLASGAEAAP